MYNRMELIDNLNVGMCEQHKSEREQFFMLTKVKRRTLSSSDIIFETWTRGWERNIRSI